MVRFPSILFLALIGLTASQSLRGTWQTLTEEIVNRKKLENKISYIKKEVNDMKAQLEGWSYIYDEMTVIRIDVESLNKEMEEIKQAISKGGMGNLPNVTTINADEIKKIKRQVDENTKKILKLKSKMQKVSNQLKVKQDNIVQNLTRLETESVKMTASAKNTINAIKEKQIRMENKQNDLAKKIKKINKLLQEVLIKQNNMTQTNAGIIGITADQKKLEKKNDELTAQQTTLVKKQKVFDNSLDNVKKIQGNFRKRLSDLNDLFSKMANNVSDMEQFFSTSNFNKSEIDKKFNDFGKTQEALVKGIGDLRKKVHSFSDCCNDNGGCGQNKERLKASNGKMFIALVPSAYPRHTRNMTILIASSKKGWFYVDNPYFGIKVNKTMVTGNNVYTVVKDINVKPLSTERNSFLIETSHDVTLYVMSTGGRASDGYHVLPYKSLAKKYVISTTEPTGYGSEFSTFISVGAVHDNTKVSFKLNTRGYITYRKRKYKRGDILSVTLNKYHTFELQHYRDLSGTFVTSSASIAVVSGNQCNRLGLGYCSQLADMVPPIRSLSCDYVVPDLPDRPGSVIHIVATVDGTSVDIYRKSGSNQTTTTQSLNAGQFCETTIKKGSLMAIRATRSVLVSQATKGTFRADPMMLNVPGKDQFQSSYRFSVPALKFKSSVSVIVESRDLAGLRLDGKPLMMNKKSIPEITINSKRWLQFSSNIAPGSHHFVHTAKHPFGLIVYGSSIHDGYAYSAGMALK